MVFDLMDVARKFIQKYFINPIQYGEGYNIVNTLFYGLIFVIILFFIYKISRKKLPIDKKFMIGLFPYIILGAVLRVLQDKGFFDSWLFVTPGIFFTVSGIAVLFLGMAKIVESKTKISYHKPWCIFGLFTLAWFGRFLRFVNIEGLFLITYITFFWAVVLFITKNLVKHKLFSKENIGLILVHAFDATTTFVSLQFFSGFAEQHVLGGLFINLFGPFGMYLLKLPVIALVLYLLDKELSSKKDRQLRNLIKFAILVLGLGPGLRNMLVLVTGV